MEVLGMKELLLEEAAAWEQQGETYYSQPRMGRVSSDGHWKREQGGCEVCTRPAAWEMAERDGPRGDQGHFCGRCFPSSWDGC